MANKKVSQLTSKPSVLTTDLFPIADPSTGQLFKTTISDLGTAIGSGVSSVNTLVGAVVLDTDDIQELVSPTNKWFTDTRARAALSASSPLVYNSGTGAFSIPAATTSVNGYLTSTDWTTFNAKQAALSGTGFVKISGTTISYDNSTYLTTSAAASTYLALAGGTMTGAIVGTTATFTNSGSGIGLGVTQSGASGDGIKITHSAGRAFNIQSSGGGYGILINNDTASTSAPFTIQKQGASVITLTDTGAGTFNSSLTASSFVKTSGTSSQFLKADGSVDSSTYALDSVVVKLAGTQTITGDKAFTLAPTFDAGAGFKNPSGLYNYITATDTGWKMPVNFNKEHIFVLNTSTAYTYTFPSATGTLALTSDLSAYLPLSGGTLTGALSGTSALFSGAVRANNPSEGATGEGLIAGQSFKIDGTGTSQRAVMYMVSNVLSDTYASGLTAQFGNFAGDKGFAFNLNTSGGYELYVKNTTWNKALTISNTNAVTLTGALSGTSASFSSTLSASSTTLTASANTYAGGALRLNSFTGGTSIYLTSSGGFFALSNGGGADHLLIASTGAATFSSTVAATGRVEVKGTNQNTIFFNQNAGGVSTGFVVGRSFGSTDTQDFFVFDVAANVARMFLTSSGNVGIGTTSPSNLLEVQGNIKINASPNGTTNLVFGVSGTNYASLRYNDADGSLTTQTLGNYPLIFGTNITERMRITSGGQVQINQATDSHAAGGLSLINTLSNSWNYVNGGDNNLYFGYNGTSKGVFAYLTGTYTALSDRNKKKDFENSTIGLNEVMQLKPTLYRMESDESEGIKELGFIAQDVKSVIPNAYVESGDFIGLNYNPIVAALTKAVQELKQQIDILENK